MAEVTITAGTGTFSSVTVMSDQLVTKRIPCKYKNYGIKEAVIIKAVHHNNIIKLHGIKWHPNGDMGMILTRLHASLADLWTNYSLDDPRRSMILWRILYDVTRAVNRCHKLGIIHGDIKPANIMLNRGLDGASIPRAVLIDFNNAVIARPDIRAYIQTLNYRAPEVDNSIGRDITPTTAVDIWSIGLLIYYLIRGKHLLKCSKENIAYVLCKHTGISISKKYADDVHYKQASAFLNENSMYFHTYISNLVGNMRSQLTCALQRNLCSLIYRCVRLDPTRRPTAAELVTELAAIGGVSAKIRHICDPPFASEQALCEGVYDSIDWDLSVKLDTVQCACSYVAACVYDNQEVLGDNSYLDDEVQKIIPLCVETAMDLASRSL